MHFFAFIFHDKHTFQTDPEYWISVIAVWYESLHLYCFAYLSWAHLHFFWPCFSFKVIFLQAGSALLMIYFMISLKLVLGVWFKKRKKRCAWNYEPSMYYFFHPSFVAISYTFIAQSAASGFKWNEGYFFSPIFFVLHLSCLPVFSLKCERGRCASWLPLKITDLETSLQSFFDFFLICRACLSSPLSSYNISAVHVKNLSLLTPFITAVLHFTGQIASFFVFNFHARIQLKRSRVLPPAVASTQGKRFVHW